MRMRGERGFTLLELLVTVALAAILLGIGVPSFLDTVRNNRMAATANDLLAAMHLARSEAVKRRAPVTVCSSANPLATPPACSAGAFNGWIVFADDNDGNGDGQPDGDIIVNGTEDARILQRHGALPDSIQTFSDGAYVSFAGTGFRREFTAAGDDATEILLCDERGNMSMGGVTSTARLMQISLTGRPQILRTMADIDAATVGECPE